MTDAAAGVRKKPRFFVIEDDPDHQKIATMTLQAAGVDEITIFGTGEEALEFFLGSEPDDGDGGEVILIDLMLPKISGFEILQTLRSEKKWKTSVMAVLTCSTSREDRSKSEEYGADMFLPKPFRREYIDQILTSRH